METVEIVVYITISIMIGMLVVGFVAGIDVKGVYDNVKGLFFGKELSYQKVTKDEFPMEAYKLWEACGYGATPMNLTLYVEGNTAYDKADFFAPLKKYNLCYSIQSEANGCGSREDVVFENPITLPSVIKLVCDEQLTLLQ